MGCDMHLYVERKMSHGWECQDIVDKSEGVFHLVSAFGDGGGRRGILGRYVQRNYVLFAVLANVRNNEETPLPFITELRELPDDVSGEIKEQAKMWDGDGHSHNWLLLSEVLEWEHWEDKFQNHDKKMVSLKSVCQSFWKEVIEPLKELDADPRNVRMVFWFDN